MEKENSGNGFQTPTNQPVEPSEVVEEVGKFPTNQEKRKTVEDFFRDFPGSQELSDREIARRCGVDHKTVGTIKKELLEEQQAKEAEKAASIQEPEPLPAEELETTNELEVEPEPILEPEIAQPPAIEPEAEPEPPQLETEPFDDTPIAEEPEPVSQPVASIVEPEVISAVL